MRLERSVFGRVKPVDRLALLAELDGRTAKGGGDGQRAGVEVDVRPAQSERFAEPEPDAERHGYKRSQSIAFHGCEDRPRIIRPNRADSWLGRRRCCDEGGRVADHLAVPKGCAHRGPQRRVNVANRASREPATSACR